MVSATQPEQCSGALSWSTQKGNCSCLAPEISTFAVHLLTLKSSSPLERSLGKAGIYEGSGYQRGQLFNRTWCFYRAINPGMCLGRNPGLLSSRTLWICSSLPAALGWHFRSSDQDRRSEQVSSMFSAPALSH